MKKSLLVLAVAGTSLAVFAADDATLVARQTIAKKFNVQPDQVHPSPIDGLYEVEHDHDFGYVTADGKFLIQGDLVNIETGEQITENRRRAERLVALKGLGEDKMIVFSPNPPIATKHVVTVFTDVDCGYCRKLHSQIADYNARGIEVRYVFWPRSGPNTDSWYRAEAVWCSDDRHTALTRAKMGAEIKSKKCDDPVAKTYEMGIQFGIRGTPMIVMPNGDIWPGYLPPRELEERLATIDAQDKKVAATAPAQKI